MEAVIEDPYILIVNSKLGSVREVLPVLEQVVQAGKPLLIMAEDVEGEALATLVVNSSMAAFRCRRGEGPGFGDRRKRMLEDVAILAGAEVIAEEIGLKLGALSSRSSDAPAASSSRRTRPRSSTARVTPTPSRAGSTRSRTRSRTPRLRLRPREAAGAAGQLAGGVAVVRGRSAAETEDEGEERPRRGRAAGHPRCPREGMRAGRRRGAPARLPTPSRSGVRGRRRAGRARGSSCTRSRSPFRSWPITPASRARSS